MQTVTKHSSKTIEQYRHNIKLLKYHLRKQQKLNETLRYKQLKHHKKQTAHKIDKPPQKVITYSMIYTVNQLNLRTKQMGLVLGDVFRMADYNYQGEITKEQFMNTILRLKSNIDQTLINEMFYAIDTDLNGSLSSDEYAEFLYAHGGCDNKEAISFQKKSAEKCAAGLKRKGIKISDFLNKIVDPCPVEEMLVKLKELKLNVNECMTLLKMWDPSLNGQIRHEVYLKAMQNVKQKDERQIQNQKFEKGVQELCIILRDRKINPITIFQESQADGKPGISQFQLEEGLKKLLPEETPFQIRKWVNLINLNGDTQITREEFISAIKSFYSIQQINKFSSEYEKLHPQLKKALNQEDIPAEQIINKLSIAIEDNGLTKAEVFHRIDINSNGLVDKQELLQGLKNLGINIGLVGKVLTVFDRDASEEVSLDQWLNILGQDVEMEEVQVPTKGQNNKQELIKKKKNNQKKTKPQLKSKEVQKQLNDQSVLPKEQSKKKPIPKQSNKAQPNKTDIIHKKTQPLKDHDKNKTLKSPQVKPSKQVKPKPLKREEPKFAEDSMIQSKKDIKNQSDHEQQPNTETLQKQIAELYAISKTNVLVSFKSIAKKKKGLNERQLSQCINELKLTTSYKEDEIRSIFQGNLASNGMFEYEEWLNELPERYGLQVVEEKLKTSTPRKSIITERNSLRKSEPPSKDNNANYEQQFENGSKVKQGLIKRGQDRQDFQSLINLVIQNQTHSEQGYKLSKFIGTEQELKLLNQKYLPLAEKIKTSKKIYKDSSFPSNISSLTDVSPASSKIENVSLLKWKHYTQLFKNPQLFQKGIEPNDICQGQLGDCYFLCSLASLAEYRRLIQRIFEYIDIQYGYFLVWLCIDGIWKLIELDGQIPVKPDGKAPVFSRCREGDQELWVILLEKAYAKAYGCYEHIVGGQPYEAIKDLTGAPGQSFSHKNEKIDPQTLWQKLYRANKSEFIMTCGTDDSQKGDIKLDEHSESVTAEGIVIGHAYSILDLTVYKGEKLIQLRNPWGTMEWKGAWSDKSAKWTAEARTALNYAEGKDDGIFWMPYDHFYKYYATTAINYIRPNYYYSSESKKSIKNLVIKIKAQSLKHGFVMVAQEDHRKKGIPSNSLYNVCHFIAINYKNGKVLSKLADQKYMYQREGSVELDSSTAENNSQFIVMVNLEKPTNINLCTYADCQFEYEVDDSLEVMLEYIEAIASMEQSQDPRKIQTDNSNNFKSWLTSVGQYAFLVFKNIGKKSITMDIDLKKPSNLELMGGLNSKLTIKPNATETIKAKIADLKQPFSFGPMSYSVS